MRTAFDTAKPLFIVSVTVPGDAEDAVGELMSHRLGNSPAIYTNFETKISRVSIYVTHRPSAPILEALQQEIRALNDLGFLTNAALVEFSRVKREDWSESWKKYFKTIKIGSRLLIKPSWSKCKPAKNQAVVILDPGLSFGTGQHATTSFCLQQLVKARDRSRAQSFLDIGSGSGILAISAAKLGYSPVQAFDFDPLAVRIAQANAKRNRVDAIIPFVRKDLTKLSTARKPTSDVICANLMANLLIQEKDKIIARLKPQGTLILAGILTAEFPDVQKAFETSGLKLLVTRIEKEWQSGTFCPQ